MAESCRRSEQMGSIVAEIDRVLGSGQPDGNRLQALIEEFNRWKYYDKCIDCPDWNGTKCSRIYKEE